MSPELPLLVVCVAIGSALGGATRFFCSGLVARAVGETFPWGTLVVNVTGSFAIGVAAGLAQHAGWLARPWAWDGAVTGFLGSYTTVSSFSLQTLALVNDGEWRRAGRNVAWSLAGCIGAVTLGYGGVVAAATTG